MLYRSQVIKTSLEVYDYNKQNITTFLMIYLHLIHIKRE